MKKVIEINEIRSKDRIHMGTKYEGKILEGHHAEITPGKCIRIFGHERNVIGGGRDFDLTFFVGAEVEYDSYNLIYTGNIVSITAKIVSITAKNVTVEAHGTKHRLPIYFFSQKNWDLDLARIAERNAETSMCI